MPGSDKKISDAVIKRLPRYLRIFKELSQSRIGGISSGKIASLMGVTASQVRQDFCCFASFGQQGYGYDTVRMVEELSNILGLNREYKMIIVGAGNIGRALVNYKGFKDEGFFVTAMFDIIPPCGENDCGEDEGGGIDGIGIGGENTSKNNGIREIGIDETNGKNIGGIDGIETDGKSISENNEIGMGGENTSGIGGNIGGENVIRKMRGKTCCVKNAEKTGGIPVYGMEKLEEYLTGNPADIAVIAVPKDEAEDALTRLIRAGIKNFWNFAPVELRGGEGIVIENINMSDSLFVLSYMLNRK
ncbi:MAG: redox-sensing transcriptional repressor Rex [Clostridiales bacterium]|jgi:NADH/NAD ratio-sensing transcriptional regulator Rex|nr:redox-sensing transcriptional repressor Rex [Clostridiales bacterium]